MQEQYYGIGETAGKIYKALENKDTKKAEEVYKQSKEASKKFEEL